MFIIFIVICPCRKLIVAELFIQSVHRTDRTTGDFGHFKSKIFSGLMHCPDITVMNFVSFDSEMNVSSHLISFASVGFLCGYSFEMFELLTGRWGSEEICSVGIDKRLVSFWLLSDGMSGVELLLSN